MPKIQAFSNWRFFDMFAPPSTPVLAIKPTPRIQHFAFCILHFAVSLRFGLDKN
jgi:hypothetical protein